MIETQHPRTLHSTRDFFLLSGDHGDDGTNRAQNDDGCRPRWQRTPLDLLIGRRCLPTLIIVPTESSHQKKNRRRRRRRRRRDSHRPHGDGRGDIFDGQRRDGILTVVENVSRRL
jgi:hypothetical protein